MFQSVYRQVPTLKAHGNCLEQPFHRYDIAHHAYYVPLSCLVHRGVFCIHKYPLVMIALLMGN